jgi:AbrB family looped-hinge helix DNA binding protein
MLLKVTSKRQVTFPRQVMDRFHLCAGDTLSISETSDGILIKPHRFDTTKLAPLKGKIEPNLPPPDFNQIRDAALNPNLRS